MSEWRSRGLFLTVALFLAFTGTGRAADPPRAFKVMIEGIAAPAFGGCVFPNNEHGTGHATSMGTITWESAETVDACAPPPEPARVKGEFVLVDAQGDRVTGTYHTVAHIDPSRVTAAGLYRITGGTGKFTNATGEGLISAEGSTVPPFEVVGQFSGTIAF